MTPLQEASLLALRSFPESQPYEGSTPAIPALCIPEIVEQDGSAGAAPVSVPGREGLARSWGATQLPAPIADAAAFDPLLARSYGSVIGLEDAAKGIDMALAPTVNMARSPYWGRSYETLGEDPYLSAALGAELVDGIQGHRVISVIKHFAAYSQETARGTPADNSIVSAQALREIYLPAFAAIVRTSQPGGIMCSYNMTNDIPSCSDRALLDGILRREWGFEGFVRSDCGAVFSPDDSRAAGVSQTKCTGGYNPTALAEAVEAGNIRRDELDALARPLLTVLFRFNLIATPHPKNPNASVPASDQQVALQTAEEGTVLLKNSDRLLPLRLAPNSRIALIGADGASPQTAGFGSAWVPDPLPISTETVFAQAFGSRLVYNTGSNPTVAAALARRADVAIVVVSQSQTEGQDLTSLYLPGNQNTLVEAVEAANPHTIVVLETGSAVVMPWLARTHTLLETWYPGEDAGPALLAVLTGRVDPAGKLPVTFPANPTAMPAGTPGTFGGEHGHTHYAEDISTGYRWYDSNGVTPAFPFGYGQTYTTFSFSRLTVTPADRGWDVAATLTNTGARSGTDVAQLYVGDPPATGEPPRQLRGFQRVTLSAGASRRIRFHLSAGDLANWDQQAGMWAVPPGNYTIWVCDSSARAELTLRANLALSGPALHVPNGLTPAFS